MNEKEASLAISRRLLLQLGPAALAVTAIGCNQPPAETAKTAPQPGGTSVSSPTASERVKPLPGTAPNTVLSKEYVQMIGRFAYLWGWTMVNSFNRRTAMAYVPEPGLRGGILPNAPLGQVCMLTDYISPDQRFVTCSNQDVAYGFGFGVLDDEPVVIQVPDFGDRFWVIAGWDARTDSFAQLGKQYGTKPGFYLFVGPHWNGKTPDGISGTFRSSTELGAFCPRVFLDDTDADRQAVQPILNQVMIYPLTQYDGKM